MAWTPTLENLNKLPIQLRNYIHDLSIRADPAGDVQELAVLRENCRALAKQVEELQEEVRRSRPE